MRVKRLPSGKKGAALFLVLIVISSLSLFGGILMVMGHNRLLMAELEIDRVKALFLAEAGLSQAVFELKRQEDFEKNGLGTVNKTMLGDGTFWVTHNPKTNEIRATGEVNGVKRALQIKYAIN